MDIPAFHVSRKPAATLLLLLGCLLILTGCGAPAGASGPGPVPTPVPPSPTAAPASATPAPEAGIAALSDEFDNAQSLSQWHNLATVDGFPNQIETIDVNTTSR